MFFLFLFLFNISLNEIPHAEISLDTIEEKFVTEDSVQPIDTANRLLFIDKIFIIGNRKTREQIIWREMDLKENQIISASELERSITVDKNRIFNTGLFTSVDINILYLSEEKIDLVINLVERWYTFPVPIFKLADRNFNDWWENQNRSLNRVDYGFRFFKYNMRGRNEKLRLTAQLGFTRTFDIRYTIPYINKKQMDGIAVFAGYAENNSIAYKTSEHKLVFLNSDSRLRQAVRAGVTMSHRQSFFSYHYLTFSYTNRSISDTIAYLNPNYFLGGQTNQKFLYLQYRYRRDLRNIAAYPLTGYLFNFQVDKYGLGIFDDINQLEFSADHAQYFDLGKNFYLSSRIGGFISTPQRQPYFNLRGLGYQQEFIHGYELYVIEGQSYFLQKTTFKKLLFSGKSQNHLIPFEQFKSIPFAVYLKSFFDSGYVNNNQYYPENTMLANRYIYGGGFGLDIVTYYDLVLRLEYSFNSINESGLFINVKAEF
ncbi:hypothetical protein BH23BAC1_BH23BAC1_18610 [soil metagenome]